MAKQPFSNLGTVLLADELIDLAFRRTSKAVVAVPSKRSPRAKARIREAFRIKNAGHTITVKLKTIIKKFPRLDEVHPFYYELADVLVGVGNLKKSLAALKWAVKMINGFVKKNSRAVKRVMTSIGAANLRRKAYGRMASVIFQIEKDLEFLKEAGAKLRKLPSIDPSIRTVVVAGYANVGKSTFVKQISTAKPEINSYPFTTKGVVVGHKKTELDHCQIIDTPGLLDRPLKERNPIELQAIIALKHLAHVIIFITDPSETCGYSFKRQLSLFREISKMFVGIPLVKVINKIDLVDQASLRRVKRDFTNHVYEIVAKEGKGVQEVFEEALGLIDVNYKNLRKNRLLSQDL